jgi:type I restriction enzyme R subunit
VTRKNTLSSIDTSSTSISYAEMRIRYWGGTFVGFQCCPRRDTGNITPHSRREEARNPAYVDFDVRLQELIEHRRDLNADIEQILLDLEKLYGEVDEVGNLPKRMGFEDRGRYDLFLEIKHATGAAFDEMRARQFVNVLVAGLAKDLYVGWQESDLTRKGVVTDIKTLADGDDFAPLGISDNDDLVETLLKRLVQHYGID